MISFYLDVKFESNQNSSDANYFLVKTKFRCIKISFILMLLIVSVLKTRLKQHYFYKYYRIRFNYFSTSRKTETTQMLPLLK